VKPGENFSNGQILAEIESAKSTFDFEAPCAGTVIKLLFNEGDSAPIESPVIEIETQDESLKNQIPSASAPVQDFPQMELKEVKEEIVEPDGVTLLGIGSYLPKHVVYNSELLKDHPDITEDYIFGVTGIRERHWALDDEKPSDMAYCASIQAIEKSGLTPNDIDAIVVSTTTPDVVMPSTACILQKKLGIRGIPAF
ncbi:MAG: biotin/lipoyl-containing protein, partial [Fibrobacter sp.]|nr:biotin/lipoyl-containing protein [Fibrobacter sp.]